MEMYVVLSGMRRQNNSGWPHLMRMAQLVLIPKCVEEISEVYFSGFGLLSRVTFGESSSLKLIGNNASCRSSVREIRCPDSLEALCEGCFSKCRNLSHATFDESSSLKVIGNGAFQKSGMREIHLPGSLEALCDECFCECRNLSRVTFW